MRGKSGGKERAADEIEGERRLREWLRVYGITKERRNQDKELEGETRRGELIERYGLENRQEVKGQEDQESKVIVQRGTFTFTFRNKTEKAEKQAAQISKIQLERKRKREELYTEERRVKQIREDSREGENLCPFVKEFMSVLMKIVDHSVPMCLSTFRSVLKQLIIAYCSKT